MQEFLNCHPQKIAMHAKDLGSLMQHLMVVSEYEEKIIIHVRDGRDSDEKDRPLNRAGGPHGYLSNAISVLWPLGKPLLARLPLSGQAMRWVICCGFYIY